MLEIKADSLKGATRTLPLDEFYKASHGFITIDSHEKALMWENMLES